MRKETLKQINNILDNHCKNCRVIDTIREDHGDKIAQSYCLELCIAGKELRRLGDQLETPLEIARQGKDLTRKTYMHLSAKGYKDKEICEAYGIGSSTLGRRKQKWGIKKAKTYKTKEDYIQLKEKGYRERDILDAWSIHYETLQNLKRKWNL